MKEVYWNGITFYEYDDERIYKNLRRMRVLYFVSTILAILTTIGECTRNAVNRAWVLDWYAYLTYFEYLLIVPFVFFLLFRKEHGKRPSELSDRELKKISKTFELRRKGLTHFPLIPSILESLLPVILEVAFCLWWGLSYYNIHYSFFLLGYWLPTYIFIYIASGLLIANAVFKKREWETTPPQAVQEAHAEFEKKKIKKEYEKLIEQCGIKFFIKYYKQIKYLPLRDVTVTESYPPNEKNERILSAKKIIDSGLTEFALNEIINTYRDVLEETEIEQAKFILQEFQPNQNQESFDQKEGTEMLIHEFIIKNGISPEDVEAPLSVRAGERCMLVFENNVCVGVIWKHSDTKNSEANGQAEIRFFNSYKDTYRVWHRMFTREGQRITYDRLEAELQTKDEYIYFGKIKGV
ncbi:MAG: hypothetical protein K2G44_00855 [Clostridia bacterium]|nr:hypothetical protein [Clostridia bacterium]